MSIQELSTAKHALLQQRLRGKLNTLTELPAIPRRPGQTPAPLSFGQSRFWFLDQWEPGSPLHTIVRIFALSGSLDIAALEHALNTLVARHESLRTTFQVIEGAPVQLIVAARPLQVQLVDLQHLPEGEREAAARRRAAEIADQPFNLEQGPLVRATLLRLGRQQYMFLLAIHHIISDGWSIGVLFRELKTCYAAHRAGTAALLPELPIQYADFAHWQRQRLQGELLDSQLAYWRHQLADAPAFLELPTDRPRPPMQSYHGAVQNFTLSETLTAALNQLSHQAGATLFMTLLAAFQTLLARYTGQDDLVVGAPIANRTHVELEGLIGFCVNTLALRTDLSGNPTFRELLRRVREVALGAYAHQDVPFEKIVEELQPERNLSHSPLFQVMFILQNTPPATLELDELMLSLLDDGNATAKLDVMLFIDETPHGLVGQLRYKTDLFDAPTIARMAGHFQTLLHAIAADADRPIATLPLLTDAEHRQMDEWNATQAEYPTDQCFHQLFATQAARTPDAVALVYAEQQLTYCELNQRANQLAHYLRALGVGPDVLVGLCVERSIAMIVGLLGILKASGAYVPLDASYPADRLALMIDDSRASVILTRTTDDSSTPLPTSGFLRAGGRQTVVDLDADWPAIAEQPVTNPVAGATAANLAYVIYTSGSTGHPKGMMIEHHSLLNLLSALRRAIYDQVPAGQLRVSLNAPASFDSSVKQIATLAYGHILDIIPQEVRLDGAALLEYLRRHRIDVLDCVPTQLRLLLAAGLLDGAGWVPRVALIGGEAIDDATWQLLARAPVTDFYNLYGPTECTVDSTIACARLARERTTIGRPLANVRVHILDRCGQPTPIGVPGELHIGGEGVGRGYLNRPELTAEKFIPNPFHDERRTTNDERLFTDAGPPSSSVLRRSSNRMYKTGDLAHWRPDGTIEYLGRVDHQVKLRGFRIELGEIAAVLSAHPRVRECVVVVREDVPGAKRLVAYVVPTKDEELAISSLVLRPSSFVGDLRDFLKQRLPDYMVPAAFALLDALPLTPNGKVDRRALPALDTARSENVGSYLAPRTLAEETLAHVWCEILGLSQVGVHDNFFAVGGDSLLSIQIVSRANQAGLSLTVKQVFQHQTIAELAAAAGMQPGIISDQGLITGHMPLTPNQRWFFEQRLPAPQHWNLAKMLETPPELDNALLEQAVQYVLLHHDALRLRFVYDDVGWSQFIAPPDQATPITRIDLSTMPELQQLAAIEATAAAAQASLNLSEGPLMRIVHFDRAVRQSGRLLVIMHHLVGDKLSYDIVIEDIQAVYRQLSGGEQPQLPPKTTSFKQWAERLAEHADSARRTELAYWLGLPWADVAPLPVDYPDGRIANTEASARTVSVSLGIEATRALLLDVPSAYGVQIMDVLLAALTYTLTGWAGSRVLLVEGAFHGRAPIFDGIDLSRTVGWLAVHPSILLDVRGADTPQIALQSIKAQLRRVPNYGIGQELLRYLSDDPAIRAQMRALPEPEVFFSFLGQPSRASAQATLFRQAHEGTGPHHHPSGIRSRLLDCSGRVVDERLQLVWRYSAHVHQRSTIEALAHSYLAVLQSLIAAHG